VNFLDNAEIFVLTSGITLIGLVLWYFFGERDEVTAGVNDSGVQEIEITVKGGYSPDVIVVEIGKPVRLKFYRDETSSCSEQVILSDLGIARDLAPFKTTPVQFIPDRKGEFPFTCGMNMLHGKLIVR
jgi:plastocyanin domain-containing protein